MRKTLLSALIVALLTGTWCASAARAESPTQLKPVVVASFSGYNELIADLKYVGEISGKPELAKGIEGLIAFFTAGRGLEGLDKDRPWGALLQIDEQKLAEGETDPERLLSGFVFLPVTDLEALLAALEGVVGKATDVGDGVFQAGKPAQPFFVKQVGQWAFLGVSPEHLAETPDDPLSFIAALGAEYDLAIRVNVSDIPESLREQAIADLEEGGRAELERKPDETDEQHAARVIVGKQVFRFLEAAANDLEQVTLGWALDHAAQKTYLDVTASVAAGTDSAGDLAAFSEAPTGFAGFLLPTATVRANWSAKLAEDSTSGLVDAVDSIRERALEDVKKQERPEVKAETAEKLINGLFDVIRGTVASGRFDGAAAAVLKSDAVTLLAGAYVADGAKLEATLKELAEAARAENPEFVAQVLKLDAEQYEGVNFHTVSIPIPDDAEDRDKIVQIVGESFEIVVGIGAESAYVSAGRDAMKTLKEAITKSREESSLAVPPMQVSLALGALADFIAELGDEEDRAQAAQLAALLADAAGKDHLNLVVKPIERGAQLRLEIEEGILKAIGTAAQTKGPGALGPGMPGKESLEGPGSTEE